VSTLEDLRRVVRRIEARHPPRPAAAVEQVVGGALQETGAGPVLRVRHDYPLTHRHGTLALGAALEAPAHLARLLAPAWADAFDPRGLLFLDTETTGLSGGTGTYAFLVGVGRVEAERFVVDQYFMRDFDEEPALLAALTAHLDGARGIVSYNGAGFDVPLLETRFALARRRLPVPEGHVDLLRPARRLWGRLLEDCRLATLEREVLGLAREDDVPGALIPSLYLDWLRTRRAGPLARVFAHNRADVLSLAALLGWFGATLAGEPARGLTAEEWTGLGGLWEPVDLAQALECYRAALGARGAPAARQRARLRLAWWEKRAARWDVARRLWEEARGHPTFDPRPWEELAKLHEHRRRDFATARTVVEEALALGAAAALGPRVLEGFAHRLARLDRRLAHRR
jgi:hypothetical protein